MSAEESYRYGEELAHEKFHMSYGHQSWIGRVMMVLSHTQNTRHGATGFGVCPFLVWYVLGMLPLFTL